MKTATGYIHTLAQCDIGETLRHADDPRATALALYSDIQDVMVTLRSGLAAQGRPDTGLDDCSREETDRLIADLEDKLFALRSQIIHHARNHRWRRQVESGDPAAITHSAEMDRLRQLRASMQDRQRMATWFRENP